MPSSPQPAALILDAPGAGWSGIRPSAWQRFVRTAELAALVYLIVISAGMLGFVDIMLLGRGYEKTAESGFAQLLWPLAYLGFAALAALHYRDLWAVARRAWWLLLFPALAAASYLWSIDPAKTVDATIRIAATTVMGLYIGSRFGLELQVRTLFWILFAAVALSVLTALAGIGFAVMDDGTARGLFHHKNTLGSRAALLTAAALSLVLAGWRPVLASVAIAVGCAAFVLSESAAGLVLAALAAVVAPVALAFRARGIGVLMRLVLIGGVACAVGFVLVGLRVDPISDALEVLGRDATLTGRVLLWEAALHHVRENPLFGVGYNAFWDAGLDWRTFAVLDRLGYVLHFHNAYIEIAVQLGALGMLVAGVTLLGYARATMLALRAGGERIALWPTLFGITALALAVVENELFVKHNLFHILLVAIPAAVLTSRGDVDAAGPSGTGTTHAQAVETENAHAF